MRKTIMSGLCITLLILAGIACERAIAPERTQDVDDFIDVDEEMAALTAAAKTSAYQLPPSGLVTVGYGGENLEFWPYTGTNFSGQPQDPVNLIFFGHADPRDIRAALLALDGDRTGFGYPAVEPFNSTWEDAIGDMQTGYGSAGGWIGNAVQLACGPYGPLRFHIRFFKMGEWTVANAHFEVQIPGTADHQVLSWERAEEFLMVDMIRTGLVDPSVDIVPTAAINDAPFRNIMAPIYNELPPDIRTFIEGPAGDVDYDPPIGTDGHALVINIQGAMPRAADNFVQDFVINYGQVIPRPFCSLGPMDYVWVEGPVNMMQTVKIDEAGNYAMEFRASGTLIVVPFDPVNEVPIGDPLTAEVREHHASRMNDHSEWTASVIYQKLMPLAAPGAGRFFSWLHVGTGDRDNYMASVWCSDGPVACQTTEKSGTHILSASPENK